MNPVWKRYPAPFFKLDFMAQSEVYSFYFAGQDNSIFS